MIKSLHLRADAVGCCCSSTSVGMFTHSPKQEVLQQSTRQNFSNWRLPGGTQELCPSHCGQPPGTALVPLLALLFTVVWWIVPILQCFSCLAIIKWMYTHLLLGLRSIYLKQHVWCYDVQLTLEVAENKKKTKKKHTTQQFKYWQSLFQQDYEMLFNIHHFFSYNLTSISFFP